MAIVVNGEVIDDSVVKAEFQSLRPRYEQMMADSGVDPVEQQIQLWEWSRENVIEKVLLRQEARKEQIPEAELNEAIARQLGQSAEDCPTPSNDESVRAETEARLQMESLIRKVAARVPRPKQSQIGDYYSKHKDEFRRPEAIHAAHIVKHVNEQHTEEEAREAIEAAMRELEAGRPFAEVADELSDCPGNGGDLGYFPRGEMVDEFERVVFDLAPGQRSGVFRTPFGYHIALVHEKLPESYRPLPEVKARIEEKLWQERKETALEEFVDKLRAKAVVERLKEDGEASQEKPVESRV